MTPRGIGNVVRKAAVLARVAARHRLSQRAAAIGRAVTYAIMLFVFSRLWSVIAAAYPGTSPPADRVLWYIAITEWIVLSMPQMHGDIQDELRAGDLLYRLTRPIAYPWARLGEGLGDLVVRMGLLGIAGFGFAYLLTGTVPLGARELAWVVPLGVLAASVGVVFELAIGFTSFWLHDCRPVYWIWQKGLFLLGGLLVPLSLYPEWLRAIAVWSPFAAILHGCGTLALGEGEPLLVGLRLLAWFAIGLGLVALVFRRGLAQLDGGGG